MLTLSDWQGARYQPGQKKGHYESWFLRANHPTRNEALWIRYTIFSPQGRPDDAIGELWAIYFNGATKKICAAKSEVPMRDCQFASSGLNVKIGSSTLAPGRLKGDASQPHRIRWDLSYRDGGPPVLFLPLSLYEAPLPKAKALSQRPHVVFAGTLEVDGETFTIDDWVGSENHNWGSKHTDSYAWGQVVGFDNAPEAFLECATVRLKFGPLWTPPLTIIVLRVQGQDYHLNSLMQSYRAQGRWQFFDWHFDSKDARTGVRISGRIHAAPDDFVGLTYFNPPGGSHTCLNSKVAACELTLERPGMPALTLTTKCRAAFEILTDDRDHGVAVVT
jgi:hypothetical protein